MKDYRRFAPLGLVFSGLSILSTIGFVLVNGIANIGLYTPPDPQILTRGIWFSLAGILLGLAITALLDPEGTRLFLTGRQAQYGSNAIIMLLAFMGVLFFINMLAYQNPKTWDLTEDKQNTLAPETIALFGKLPEPVIARAYFTSQTPNTDAKNLLQKLKENSNGKFDYTFIDPNFEPLAAKEDDITRDGTIMLHMGGKKSPVNFATEQEIAIAMIKLVNPQSQVIYFLVDHGEKDTENPGESSFTYIKKALTDKNYTVKLLSLASTGSVPADAAAVVIAGPIVPLAEAEVTALSNYLDAGGGLVVMEDSPLLTNYKDIANPLDDLLAKWGVGLKNDIVVDPNTSSPLFAVADTQSYARHPITANLRGVLTTFPTTRSLTVIEGTPYSVTALVATGANAWGETDVDSMNNSQVSFDPATDNPGPVTLAISSEDFARQGRLVVFGDSEFAIDTLYAQGNFGDILTNAIDWVAEQENLINLTVKTPVERTYNPPSGLEFVGIILSTLCLIPLIVIGGGVWAWASRRRRG